MQMTGNREIDFLETRRGSREGRRQEKRDGKESKKDQGAEISYNEYSRCASQTNTEKKKNILGLGI